MSKDQAIYKLSQDPDFADGRTDNGTDGQSNGQTDGG